MTIHCPRCSRPLPATRDAWCADDHDGAHLIAECPEHGVVTEVE